MFGTLFGAKRPDVTRRVSDLEDSLGTLQRQVRALELEWESTYNKLRAIVARLNKRAEREQADEVPPEPDAALAGSVSRRALGRNGPAPQIPRRNY